MLLGTPTSGDKEDISASAKVFLFFEEEGKKSMVISSLWTHNQFCVGLILSMEMREQYKNMVISGSQQTWGDGLRLRCLCWILSVVLGIDFFSSSVSSRAWATSHREEENHLFMAA